MRRTITILTTALTLAGSGTALAQDPPPGGPSTQPPPQQPQPEPEPQPQPQPPPNNDVGNPPPADSPDPPAPKDNGPGSIAVEATIDPQKLADNVRLRFMGNSVGGAVSVAKGGKIYSARWGNRRTGPDGNLAFSPLTRIEVMSVTKNMTAYALLRLLQLRNISVDASVGQYLPEAWAKGPGFSDGVITFRHLLTHTSGIWQLMNGGLTEEQMDGLNNGFDGVKFIVANGSTPVEGDPQYKNMNYALMRILIPELWKGVGGPDGDLTAHSASKRYLDYITEFVLKPSGILRRARCWEPADLTAAMVYDKDNPAAGGRLVEAGDITALDCGGHTGLHLSTYELVKVLRTVRHTNKIINAQTRKAMFDGRLGWNESSNGVLAGTGGIWWHGGDGFWGAREVHTCVMDATQNIEIGLIINSDEGAPRSQCGGLLDELDELRFGKS